MSFIVVHCFRLGSASMVGQCLMLSWTLNHKPERWWRRSVQANVAVTLWSMYIVPLCTGKVWPCGMLFLFSSTLRIFLSAKFLYDGETAGVCHVPIFLSFELVKNV